MTTCNLSRTTCKLPLLQALDFYLTKYHSAENDYRCKSLINSKTISVSKKNTEITFAELINSKNNNVRMKLQTLQILQIFIECKDHGRWCVGAHIQAFTFSSQDHGRLSIVHWVLCGVCGVRVVCVCVSGMCVCVCVCCMLYVVCCMLCVVCCVLCCVLCALCCVFCWWCVVWCCVVLCGVVRLERSPGLWRRDPNGRHLKMVELSR